MSSIPIPSFIGTVFQRKASHGQMNPRPKAVNPLTYPKSAAPFSADLFKNPTSEYRGAPLWSWNNKLDKAQLLRQIDYFEEMGMGGFHIHVRVGLDTEYMGSEFMDMVRACVDYAESKNMLACLYDEDRFPSGAAGGKVMKDHPEYKEKHILFTPQPYGTVPILGGDRAPTSGRACRSENGSPLAVYDIELDENGCLKSSHRLKKGETGKNVWYAYVEKNPDGSPWFNGQTYVDTLSKKAMGHFIDITHEVYKDKVGDKFGSVVPCIFTDEPQFALKTQLGSPWSGEDIFLPWTTDLAESFAKEYSTDLVEVLPELVWDLPDGKVSVNRYHWHDHTCERFVSAFLDQIGNWCRENGIMLNGHMMEEPSLWSQTTAIGEAMRCYRSMEMPGMDLLVDGVELNTAKQCSSVSRQNGTRGTMSEIYGVTHWYFTFEGHKGCGDWQAALGITFRVHHLTWVSMAGEGKRDYPACIGYQSPWFKEYGYVEDHFARVGVVLTRGQAVTKVGVIHPIESYWLGFGPNGMGDEQWRRDVQFGELSHWLLHGLIDFDFISESLLPNQVTKKINGKALAVGHCEYEVIIVPNLRTIRSSTLKILQDFARAGGKVMIAGTSPELVDAKIPKHTPTIDGSKNVFWSQQGILLALDGYRDIRAIYLDGSPSDRLLYQMRQDGDERFVFMCNMDRGSPVNTVVHLKGQWNVTVMDTFTGDENSISTSSGDGWTKLPYKFEGCASLLLRLSPRADDSISRLPPLIVYNQGVKLPAGVTLYGVELSEPNVLMLDYAEFKLRGQDWSGSTEILQIDNTIRGHLGLPYKGLAWKQPWAIPESERAPVDYLTLRFAFESSFSITETTILALEDAEERIIHINDTLIPSSGEAAPLDWWVDEAIKMVPIPANIIKEGTNIITLEFPFGILTNLERIYLLGNFAVSLENRRDICLHPLRLGNIEWGDIVNQGLPFYVGNITYTCGFTLPSSASDSSHTALALSVPQFSSPVLAVTNLKTKEKIGRIAFQPHMLALGKFEPGTYELAVTAFGNRYNSFGHFHVPDGATDGCQPNMWRTGGDWWSPDYYLKPIGVLECPKILPGEEEDQAGDVAISKNVTIGENVTVCGSENVNAGKDGWVTVERSKSLDVIREV